MDNQPDQTSPIQSSVPTPPPVDSTSVQPPVQAPSQTPPPTPPSDQTKPKKRISKWLILLIAVIILVLLAGLGYFMLSKKTQTVTPTPTPATQTTAPTETSTATPTPSSSSAEMKTFTSAKLANISFQGFTIQYPSDWTPTSARDDSVGTATLILTKGDYSITIKQGAFDSQRCVYTDADFNANQGAPLSDKRRKVVADVTTGSWILKRDQEEDANGNNSYAFCQQSPQDPTSYNSVTKIGAISYTGPATFDPATLTEMDTIIKSVQTL